MAKRNIVTDGDEILKKKSREVTEFNEKLWMLLDDMAETMYSAEGVGLAAVQVGVLKRVVTIDSGDGLLELINPVIIEESEELQDGPEGCLSFPNVYGEVVRPMRVKIKAQDRNGKLYEKEGEELLARAFCHEIDHLDGKVFVDIAKDLMTVEEKKSRRKHRFNRNQEG